MKLVTSANKVSIDELKKMASKMFGNLVKAVVDIEKKVMVVDGELHSDEEAFLLNRGSKQENVWGINLYPDLYPKKEWIEFDSMINVRPYLNHPSRGVEDKDKQKKIVEVVNSLVIA